MKPAPVFGMLAGIFKYAHLLKSIGVPSGRVLIGSFYLMDFRWPITGKEGEFGTPSALACIFDNYSVSLTAQHVQKVTNGPGTFISLTKFSGLAARARAHDFLLNIRRSHR
jgi:hypothetical protein